MHKLIRLLAVIGLFSLQPTQAQAQYDFQAVTHPGATSTQVFGVSNRGDLVGTGSAIPDTLPFVYDSKKGAFTDVASLAGYSLPSLLDINDPGDVVGGHLDPGGSVSTGFVRDTRGNYSVFAHPDAVSLTQARGVNNRGLVTGFRDDASGKILGFIYDPRSGVFTDLNPTSYFTIAQGINSRGEVVGSSNFFAPDRPCPEITHIFPRFGWLRTSNGSVNYFVVNGLYTSARGINDKGEVVGWLLDELGNIKGFKVELDGSPCQELTVAEEDLIEFPGAARTFPQGINNAGIISGSYEDDTTSHGFIATPQ